MEEDNHQLLQPFLSSTTTIAATVDIPSTPFPPLPSSSIEPAYIQHNNIRIIPSPPPPPPPRLSSDTFGIILRLALVFLIGAISIWANHEASKGFSVSIINEALDKSSRKRFDLFYVSNDEASRLLLTTSKFVENFLYPNAGYPKKQVSNVVLRLSSRNLSQPVIVNSGEVHDQFVIHLSPSILGEVNFKDAMLEAIRRGMARLWLWDGLGNAPSNLVNGIVEYVSELAVSGGSPGFRSVDLVSGDIGGHFWNSKNAVAVARFLNYCEVKRPGFIRRLNRDMRNAWHDRMVDDAFGVQDDHHLYSM